MRQATTSLIEALDRCPQPTRVEALAVRHVRALAARTNPWTRDEPLHVTASALVLHPPTRRVLLRRHARLERWMQVGGHGDEGEADPLAVALREAAEETGLSELRPWPQDDGVYPVQITIVGVPANSAEPAHEHADIRYLFATDAPERAMAESPDAPIRWTDIDDALDVIDEENLREFLRRAMHKLDETGC
jgi:8-oxo-dGTP pyrophosphatase MutT (NUDIX family)